MVKCEKNNIDGYTIVLNIMTKNNVLMVSKPAQKKKRCNSCLYRKNKGRPIHARSIGRHRRIPYTIPLMVGWADATIRRCHQYRADGWQEIYNARNVFNLNSLYRESRHTPSLPSHKLSVTEAILSIFTYGRPVCCKISDPYRRSSPGRISHTSNYFSSPRRRRRGENGCICVLQRYLLVLGRGDRTAGIGGEVLLYLTHVWKWYLGFV